MPKTRSFFERLTGSVPKEDYFQEEEEPTEAHQLTSQPPQARLVVSQAKTRQKPQAAKKEEDWMATQDEEGQLTVDVYQTGDDIVVQSTVAGVRPDDVDVQITRDMLTIRGKREQAREVAGEDYYYQELYWGSFSRSIMLPHEVDVDEAEATLKNGLLTIKLPKLDKNRTERLRVKTREE